MPESFMFNTIDEAVAGAEKDFNDAGTPDSKGFMIVSIEKAIGIDRNLNLNVDIEDYIMRQADVEEMIAEIAEEVADEEA
jgi:hypothetical protein